MEANNYNVKGEATQNIAVPQKVLVSVKFVEGHNPKHQKFWAKLVHRVNPNQNNGYAFEGEWFNGWGSEKTAVANEGQLILIYAEDGSWKHTSQIYAIGTVQKGETSTLNAKYYIKKVVAENVKVLYILRNEDGWDKESTALFKEAMQKAGRTITNPWDCLKILVGETIGSGQ